MSLLLFWSRPGAEPPPPAVTITSFGIGDAFSADHSRLRSKPGKGEQKFTREVEQLARRSGLAALREARHAEHLANEAGRALQRKFMVQTQELRRVRAELDRIKRKAVKQASADIVAPVVA